MELADALGIDKFAVAGTSGGGPATLACAWKIPDRLISVGIISGPCPPEALEVIEGLSRINRVIFTLTRRSPWLIRLNMAFLAFMAHRNPDRIVKRMLSSYPEVDQAVLARPEVGEFFGRYLSEAFRQGGSGSAHELVINHGRPWPFRLEEVSIEVHLWQGEADNTTPPSMGRYMAARLPNCHATFIPNAGHLWVFDHLDEVLKTLVPLSTRN